MGRKKKILVKDVLGLMEEKKPVIIMFYAYGISHASSYNDGLRTVKDCKEMLNYDCANARVFDIDFTKDFILISAEIVH